MKKSLLKKATAFALAFGVILSIQTTPASAQTILESNSYYKGSSTATVGYNFRNTWYNGLYYSYIHNFNNYNSSGSKKTEWKWNQYAGTSLYVTMTNPYMNTVQKISIGY